MDLVLLGGNVLTMDKFNRRAEAVAERGGKVAAVGANAEIEKLIAPETQVVRLAGRTVTPGFIDLHNHFSISTLDPVAVDCSVPSHDSIQSILEAIAAAAKGTPKGQWVRGWGFRSRSLREGRCITRWELDEAAPDNPVCIVEGSVHGVTVNSLALRLAGIDRHTPDRRTARSFETITGNRTGRCGSRPRIWSTASRCGPLDYYGDDIGDLVRQNCMRHLSLGITSVGDALVVPEAAEMYRLADSQEKLPMVVHQMLGGDGFFDHPDKVARGEVRDGNVSDRLRGGTVKMFMDPVFPSAARIRFHLDGKEERFGERYYTQEEGRRARPQRAQERLPDSHPLRRDLEHRAGAPCF